MRIFRDLVLLLVIFGLIWLGFSYWAEPKSHNNLISIEQEAQIEEKINEILLRDFEVFNDSVYQLVLDSVSARLLTSIDSPLYDNKFTMLDSDQVNAFCSFSGKIFIFRALIDECENAEDLAAILAHEIGHAQERHVIKNLIRELGLTTVSIIISGGDPIILDQISRVLISSTFTRELERQADDFAFNLLEKANINPQHLAAFFIRLKSSENQLEIPDWLSSHPSLEERIERIVEKKTKENFMEVKIDVRMPERSKANEL